MRKIAPLVATALLAGCVSNAYYEEVLAQKTLVSPVFQSPSLSFLQDKSAEVSLQNVKILVVLSTQSKLKLKDGTYYQTGHYLGELYEPLFILEKLGIDLERQVVFATVGESKKPSVDKNSLNGLFWLFRSEEKKRALSMFDEGRPANLDMPRLLHTMSADEIRTFDTIFFPGGHAPMIDLHKNKQVGELLLEAKSSKQVIASICHAPIVFRSILRLPPYDFTDAQLDGPLVLSEAQKQAYPFHGYRVTAFSNAGEEYAEKNFIGKKNSVVFTPETELYGMGFNLHYTGTWFRSMRRSVVWDRELVTGQNQFTPDAFGRLWALALLRRIHLGNDVERESH